MLRKMLKSKIHRARVTGSDLNYEGSITVDASLLEKADIREFESVQVVNISNGSRLETYAVRGQSGSGIVELNGAAARLVQPGDLIIIMAFAYHPEPDLDDARPTILLLDEKNQVKEILC